MALIIVGFNACREDNLLDEIEDETKEEIIDLTDYADWNDTSHSKSADLNYSTVFNQNEVLRFDIKISNENWSTMQSDLAVNMGSSTGGPGGGGPGGATINDYDPIWVPCSFQFNDTEWYHVGVRFKGNSSLRSTYQSGNKKLSFKLDFDEFEDDYPTIKNQRFLRFQTVKPEQ